MRNLNTMTTVVFFTVAFFTTSLHAALPQPVLTADGLLQGMLNEQTGISVFRGIPYAAAPVGANRWREPQATTSWAGIRSAQNSAPRCVQRGFAPGATQALTSEDCLYLNIWTPAEAADAALPVMIWIHGGGFFGGSGSDANYDGEALATRGAVVVTINYRLGSFGFFAHPELIAESVNGSTGNYGLLDMLASIQWVKQNIAGFGGNPGNITIMGESAGAKAVAALIVSPLSAGLFQRAILQSAAWMGWSGLSLSAPGGLDERAAAGAQQATAFGATSLADLRNASAQAIAEKLATSGDVTLDGYLLPKDPSLLLAAGQQAHVDILAGTNRDEAVFFGPGLQTAAEFIPYARNKYGAALEQFLALYPADTDAQANASYLQAWTDEMAWQIRKLGQYQASAGKNAWIYYFTHVPPGQEARGATHVAELNYMFNHAAQGWTSVDINLANSMSSYWVNFARTGNPNGPGLPQWPAYRNNSKGSVLVLGDEIGAETEVTPSAEVLELIDAVYAKHLDEAP